MSMPSGAPVDLTSLAALDATLRDAAARAAAFIAERASSRADLTWEHKGPADFVSAVDRGAESIIRDALLTAYPDAAFLGEESYDPAAPPAPGLGFVVDPLDGTTNFLHGFPWYAVSIAATLGGQPVAATVQNAATGETFSATRDGGARRRAHPSAPPERIRVSPIDAPERALIGTGFPFKILDQLDRYTRQFAAITRATAGIRRPGSAALDLCDVACGRFEAFWELNLAPWDIAAGILLVREAGGIVTTADGADPPIAHTSLCAGNPPMHRWLLATLRAA